MKMKLKKFMEKNKRLLLIICIVILAIIIAISLILIINKINSNGKINIVNQNNYSLQYDNTWKVKLKEDNQITLEHKKTKSTLNIIIHQLSDDEKYKSIDELFDNLLYNIEKQNENYNLLYREKTNITQNNLEGYKILFESENAQAEILTYKQGEKLIVINYEALNEYFDILLDSANCIIDSFSIKEETFDLKTNINIDTTQINYSEQEDVSSMLNGTTDYEIASSNYFVNYTIPSNFKSISFDTTSGYYEFENTPNDGTITLNTTILNRNIYEYLDKEDSPNVYEKYNLNSYNESKEQLEKVSDDPITYIYKNSYLTFDKTTENIVIMYELNQNHIFIVEISSNAVGIPKDLVNMIKVNSYKNIANNITIEKEDNLLIGNLKSYVGYATEQIEEIKIKLPEDYQEIDKETNLYEDRTYVKNYNDEKEIYNYEVNYSIIKYDIDSKIETLENSINKEYGEYTDFTQESNKTYNNKEFIIYNRRYTNRSNAKDSDGNYYTYHTNEKVLFYKISDEDYLVIEIRANDNDVTDELVNEVTKFNTSLFDAN